MAMCSSPMACLFFVFIPQGLILIFKPIGELTFLFVHCCECNKDYRDQDFAGFHLHYLLASHSSFLWEQLFSSSLVICKLLMELGLLHCDQTIIV
jgi:hypothetical protein